MDLYKEHNVGRDEITDTVIQVKSKMQRKRNLTDQNTCQFLLSSTEALCVHSVIIIDQFKHKSQMMIVSQ